MSPAAPGGTQTRRLRRCLTPRSKRQIAASCNLRLTSNVRPRAMSSCATVPLQSFSWCSPEIRSSRSVCGPSVRWRPANLTAKLQTKTMDSRFVHGQRSSNVELVQRRFGLSVLRRPAHQPRHIEPTESNRSSFRVCSAWLAGRVQQNHQMQVTPHHLQPQRNCSGTVWRVRGTSPRRSAVRQSPWPNTSVEATNCSKLQFAPHLERWAA